jgi:hypothetical protein
MKSFLNKSLVVGSLVCGASLVPCFARAQSVSLDRRVDRLEQIVTDLQHRVRNLEYRLGNGSAPSSGWVCSITDESSRVYVGEADTQTEAIATARNNCQHDNYLYPSRCSAQPACEAKP